MDWIVAVTFILIQYCGFVFGDICYIDETEQYDHCDDGCCGRAHENNRRCCTETDILIWIIVASIVGGILLISFIVAVVYCLIKSNGRKGMVVTPTYTANQTTTVYQVPLQASAPTAPPPYGFNPQPPPYGQQYVNPVPPTNGQHNQFSTQQPNSGNDSNPAFPPPAPAQY